MMDSVFKMMYFVFQMVNLGRFISGRRCRLWVARWSYRVCQQGCHRRWQWRRRRRRVLHRRRPWFLRRIYRHHQNRYGSIAMTFIGTPHDGWLTEIMLGVLEKMNFALEMKNFVLEMIKKPLLEMMNFVLVFCAACTGTVECTGAVGSGEGETRGNEAGGGCRNGSSRRWRCVSE